MAATQLVWLRNDLRLEDHPGIYQARQQGDIAIVFIATMQQWQEHNEAPAKLALKSALLQDMAKRLHGLAIPLHVVEAELFSQCPQLLVDLCQRHGYQQVWWQNELPLHEAKRDATVAQQLTTAGVGCQRLAPDLIVSGKVLHQQGTPFKVFTPFYRRWLAMLQQQLQNAYPAPEPQTGDVELAQIPQWGADFREDLWSTTQELILARLWSFCKKREASYGEQRDLPATPGTSTLSPYLALGAIGPRQCLDALRYCCEESGRAWQDSIWLKEMAWRDFYRQLMGFFPELSRLEPFKPETNAVQWRDDEAGFQAWCEGRTGFPIVDAAMRQLNQTGWMHNRLRMIAASFLTKLLLIDWRKGEAYFMSKLIDGEFAANNGGWHWSASTGCDAVPYFRVFNPLRQSEKFDPAGDFIRRFVPELQRLDSKQIHDPSERLRQVCQYPTPIVDYKSARQRAIDAFASLKS